MKVLVCKITNKEFKDIENKSGAITEHLKRLSISVPSSFLRRKYLRENHTPWHLQFFTIVDKKEKEKFKCKYCNWETYDKENRSGCYTSHLLNNHVNYPPTPEAMGWASGVNTPTNVGSSS
ncbi:MAG: hypothetical protein KatS3mg035_1121 [Bacteroidia bacterium]|nr:MAG: hypothetical protein KatS3mg035_1121 [Bacteroidia bacterium]